MGGYHRCNYQNTFYVTKAVLLRKARLGLADVQLAKSNDLQTNRLNLYSV